MSHVRVCISLLQCIAVSAALPITVYAQSPGGLTAAPGARTGPGAPGTRALRGGSSVIGDGMGGFTIYNSSGATRHIGGGPAPGSVYDAQGRRYQVIEDGQGNLDVLGPSGTHKVMRTRSQGTAQKENTDARE